MFFLRRPSDADVAHYLNSANLLDFNYAAVGATRETLPAGFTHDRNQVSLGCGLETYRAAVRALRRWEMFDLGWLRLFTQGDADEGVHVVSRIYHFGFWSLNPCRVVYLEETGRRCSFAYGTLFGHAEQGEEQFTVDWSAEDDIVTYKIVAFSRPQAFVARLGTSLARLLQKRFAGDSKAAMVRALQRGSGR